MNHIQKVFFLSTMMLWLTFPVSAQSVCDTTKTVRCVSVYPSGYKKSDYRYKQGARHGIWIEFNESGKIIRKTKYRRGVRIWEFRYVNNRVVESINRKGVVKKVKDCGC